MKRLIIAGIIFVMALSMIMTVEASEAPSLTAAESKEIIWGDADGDDVVTIRDVTRIQKHLVQLSPIIEAKHRLQISVG